MASLSFPPLAISPFWRSVQDHLLQIVDLIPDDKLDWTPKAELWNARGILIHVADARDAWLSDGYQGVQDGAGYPNIWTTARTKDDIRREMARTYERVERFLANAAWLETSWDRKWNNEWVTGHWVAFHLLKHDIHHRAELLQRLALLDVAHEIDI